MIKDKLARAKYYHNLSEGIKIGFEWLESQDLKNLPDGKYIINNSVYANIQTYLTKQSAPFEAHHQYVDIQYMISGKERIGVADTSECANKVPYDIEKDIEFLECNISPSYQYLSEGEFLLLFPHDAHQPSLSVEKTQNVKKVVVKVRL